MIGWLSKAWTWIKGHKLLVCTLGLVSLVWLLRSAAGGVVGTALRLMGRQTSPSTPPVEAPGRTVEQLEHAQVEAKATHDQAAAAVDAKYDQVDSQILGKLGGSNAAKGTGGRK